MKPAEYLMLFVGLFAVIAVAFQLWRATRRKDNWGINLARINCPNCGEPAPMLRTPNSFKQMMWGGHTCSKCGTTMDKWGRKIG
jgi:hypothetical protein